MISNVTGDGIDLLKVYFSKLNVKEEEHDERVDQPFEFDLNDNFVVPGVGVVVSGLIKTGVATVNKLLLLGNNSYHYYYHYHVLNIVL